MKLILAGMSPQESAAMGLLVGKTLPGWHCAHAHSLAELAQPSCDLYVLDLPGLGMPRYNPDLAASLLQALAGVPAILTTTLHDRSWSELESVKAAIQSLTFMRKPYKAQDMRLALEQQASQILQRQRAAHSAPSAAYVVQANPARNVISVQFAEPAAPPVLEPGELSAQQYQARVQALGADQPTLFLHKLADGLATDKTFEIRFTLQYAMVVCPEEHWVATNIPMGVIERLVASDGLASVVHLRSLGSEAGLQMAQRLGMTIEPLESFLWELLKPLAPNVQVAGSGT
jgi:hypothetical protein